MEFEKEVNYLGIEEKVIKNGDKAGQKFYVLKFICLNDPFEVSIFDDPILVGKFVNFERFQDLILRLKLSQKNGVLKLQLLDLVA